MNGRAIAVGPSSPEVVEMAVCESCGTMVPAANLPLHETRACPNRKLPPRPMNHNLGGSGPSGSLSGQNMERQDEATATTDPAEVVATTSNATRIPLPTSAPLEMRDADRNATDDSLSYSSPLLTARSVTVIQDDDRLPSTDSPRSGFTQPSSPIIVDGFEVLEYPSSGLESGSAVDNESPWRRLTSGLSNVFGQSASLTPAAPSYPGTRRRCGEAPACGGSQRQPAIDLTEEMRDHHESAGVDAQWPCPRCTLLNRGSRSTCEACFYRQHEHRRRDPQHRQWQHQNQAYGQNAQPDVWYGSPTSTSLRSTQNVAIGGAIFGGVVGAASALARGRPVAGAALDGALNGAVGSVFLNNMVQQVEAVSTRSADRRAAANYEHYNIRAMREHMRLDELMALRLMEEESSRNRLHFNADPRSGRYILSIGGIRRQPEMDVSQMSYEELLARFGDGTENRGASAAQLNALPVQTIDCTSKLTEGNKKCLICLEEFIVGDKRKMLPCLHSYHESCANTWLKSNASCPVCKHRLGE